MANTEFFTRLQLKYDSYENWSDTTVTGQKGNLVLLAGEIGICTIPSGATEAGVHNPPHIMFKVGDGTTAFHALPWASAKAADVHAWAKESQLTVSAAGTGNVVASIEWDASLNGGKGGIKYTTASVATSQGLEDLQKDVKDLEDAIAALDADLSVDTGYYVSGLVQVDGKITELKKTALPAAATPEQGAKADSAMQSIAVLGKELEDGDELTVAEAKTALGLGSAAYTEANAYATKEQGEKADTAIQTITDDGTGQIFKKSGTTVTANVDTTLELTNTSNVSIPTSGAVVGALGALSSSISNDYVKKAEAPGYDDILTKTEAEETYAPLSAVEHDELSGNEDVFPTSHVVKTYVDTQDAATLADAKEYANTQDAATLKAAQDYADAVKKEILTGDSTAELDEAYDTLLEIQQWMAGAGGDATNLSAALAAEVKAREEGDTALNNRIDNLDADKNAADGKYIAGIKQVDGLITEIVEKELPVDTLVTGDNNGQVKFNGTNVDVKGLGSAAYTEASAYATKAQGEKADTAVQPAAIADMLTKTEAPGYDDILTKTEAEGIYVPLEGIEHDTLSGNDDFVPTSKVVKDYADAIKDYVDEELGGLGEAANKDVATAIDPMAPSDDKLATEKAVANALTSFSTTVNNTINALDSTVTGSGPVVTNVIQTDGKVAVTKGNITLDQVAGNTKENYVIFNCGSSTEVI